MQAKVTIRAGYPGRNKALMRQSDPPASAGPDHGTTIRTTLLLIAAAYTMFVIYGSLVPLHFQHRPWSEAWMAFHNIRYLNLGIGSRADWVANTLLFIPLAFGWLGVLWHEKRVIWRVPASFMVLAACIFLSIGIEFTQIFFPPRTVSLNDIYAETLGAGLGVILWWVTGPHVVRWYAGWKAAQGVMDLTQRLLYFYLFLLFGYNVLPLDLTISPVEIYHKWHEGRVVFLPFSDIPTQPVQALYSMVTDMLLWVPAGLLARLPARRSARQIWIYLSAAAALIEFLQLFVFSRVTSVTDILTGSLGSALGIVLASRWQTEQDSQDTQGGKARIVTKWRPHSLTLGVALWLGLIFAAFWYPFDFHTNGIFIRDRLAEAAARAPFAIYYFGTEYRAVTEVLHKMGLFFPLGLLLALRLNQIRPSLYPWKTISLVVVAIIAGVIELGQLCLPGKFADLTDWVLESAGGWAGCALAWRLQQQPVRPIADTAPSILVPQRGPWPFVCTIVLGLAILFWGAAHLSVVPYNVRELIKSEYPWLSALLFTITLVWVFGFPAWFAGHLELSRQKPVRLPLYIFLHCFIAWIFVRLAAPLESIYDIVGSPVLDWPWEWELMGRFLALFTVWSVISFGAVLFSLRRWLSRAGEFILIWAIIASILLPLAYLIVIKQAATDNLTELLAGGGTPLAFFWVSLGVFVLALAGSRLACAVGSSPKIGVIESLAWGVASFPLTYLALHAGLEAFIIKYGRAFSALQFLLSSDREHYAPPLVLLLRFGIAHASMLFLLIICQAPFFGRLVLVGASQTDRPVRRKETHRKKRPNIRE